MASLAPSSFHNGLEWHIFNHGPQVAVWKDKVFEDYYVLDYANQGQIEWAMDSMTPYWLEGPLAFWTFPGPRFQFGRRDGGSWDHYFVAFKGPRADHYAETGLLPVKTRPAWIKIHDAERFRIHFEELLKELDKPVRNQAQTVHLLEGLLIQLHQQTTVSDAGHPHESRLRMVMNHLLENPAQNWNFEIEAEKAGLSYPHFRRLFREISGLPLHRFLLKVRMDLAARKLRGTEEEIKTIALESGFEDIYHFSKLFKGFYKVPPGHYRRMARTV